MGLEKWMENSQARQTISQQRVGWTLRRQLCQAWWRNANNRQKALCFPQSLDRENSGKGSKALEQSLASRDPQAAGRPASHSRQWRSLRAPHTCFSRELSRALTWKFESLASRHRPTWSPPTGRLASLGHLVRRRLSRESKNN